jgi:hypothetical protein
LRAVYEKYKENDLNEKKPSTKKYPTDLENILLSSAIIQYPLVEPKNRMTHGLPGQTTE